MSAVVASVGAVCAIGNGIAQVDASFRAGIGASRQSSIFDSNLEPMVLALVPEDCVEPLGPLAEQQPWPAGHRRMLRLAGPALREALVPLPVEASVAMFVGLPAPQPRAFIANGSMLVPALLEQAQVRVATTEAHVLPFGRASALMALEAGLRCLKEGRADWVIVGGMDSHVDLSRLGALDAEQRLLGAAVMDGFIPGEGAGFALLTHERTARQYGHLPRVRVLAASSVVDPGHRYGTEPAKGEGLSNSLTRLFQQAPEPGKIRQTYAGLNGESFGVKEWGVSRIRHAARFAEDSGIEHPADCYGDVGAATGAILLGLAERALARGDHSGPALIWCSSDREHCSSALLDLDLPSQ